ncbi:MAG: ATP synthase F0 subunit B [Deltaproteobacteria bacterium]
MLKGVFLTMLDLPFHLVANERPLINVDATLFINIGLWIFLFVALRGLLWEPMIKLITAREAGMQGSRDKAGSLQTDAKATKAAYDLAMKQARESAQQGRDKLRADGKKKEAEILATARDTTQASLDAQRASLRTQSETLRSDIRASVPQLASEIASKVLGREVRS